jgi:hypothetical protein
MVNYLAGLFNIGDFLIWRALSTTTPTPFLLFF